MVILYHKKTSPALCLQATLVTVETSNSCSSGHLTVYLGRRNIWIGWQPFYLLYSFPSSTLWCLTEGTASEKLMISLSPFSLQFPLCLSCSSHYPLFSNKEGQECMDWDKEFSFMKQKDRKLRKSTYWIVYVCGGGDAERKYQLTSQKSTCHVFVILCNHTSMNL